MKRRRIGRTSLVVSEIALGTMTFGSTCSESEAFRILDRAVEAGIDFFDTAEIYPVPPDASYVHRSEEILGRWLVSRPRESVFIATKFCGPGHGWFVPPVRHGRTAIDRHHIRRAVEGSLRRLQTDYIDLYQTHWPDHDFPYEETLETLNDLITEGLVRYIGCSNENAWGLMKSLWVADVHGWKRYESIQNNFSILNRRFEDELAEICRREQVSLLPYSPMAGGVLTGKYNRPDPPADARFIQYRKLGERQQAMASRFVNEKSLAATAELVELAGELGVHPGALAVAWSKQHDFVASTIIGTNSLEQLEEILPAADLVLDEAVLKRIDAITARYPYPLG
ncbi:MAG: aldo/keto reductase [Pirellulaceae bacterium]|nr:MAG: aldo/keto reductase [Pirellulaceae bacterium]